MRKFTLFAITTAATLTASTPVARSENPPAPRPAESRPRSTDPRADAPSRDAARPDTRPDSARPAPSSHGGAERSTTTSASESPSDLLWSDLMSGNARFVAGRVRERELLHTREELAEGQHPKVMVLACADSRVSPEIVFDKNLGDLFVVRVAGNVAEPVAVGSLEYAADHLHSKLLVVLGHDSCGAVAAAASGEWMPSANLHAVVRRIAPAIASVPPCDDKDELAARQVKANVLRAAADLLQTSSILREEVEAGRITIVPAVYHLSTGAVERLDTPNNDSRSADSRTGEISRPKESRPGETRSPSRTPSASAEH